MRRLCPTSLSCRVAGLALRQSSSLRAEQARTLATMRQREEVVVTTVLRARVDRRAAKRGTSAPVAPEQAERPAARSGAAEAVREESPEAAEAVRVV